MNAQMDGWMDGWLNGSVCVCVCVFVCVLMQGVHCSVDVNCWLDVYMPICEINSHTLTYQRCHVFPNLKSHMFTVVSKAMPIFPVV